EVVELIGLREKRDDRVRRLSGGQRRRLDLGLALVGDPELIFLDEPTTGFDPRARRQAWETIRTLRGLGKTILLTTHYLDEAERRAPPLPPEPGACVLHVPPADRLLRPPRLDVRQRPHQERGRRARLELPRGGDDRLWRDLDRVRWSRDRARDPAGVGSPEAA